MLLAARLYAKCSKASKLLSNQSLHYWRISYPKRRKGIRADFEGSPVALVNPIDKLPKDTVSSLLRVVHNVVDSDSLTIPIRLVVEDNGRNGFMLEGFSKNEAAWQCAFSMLIAFAELDNNLGPRVDYIPNCWRLGLAALWPVPQHIGKDGLGVFSSFKGEQMNRSGQRKEQILL